VGAGAGVHITIDAHDSSGRGPLTYVLSFGDGTSDQPVAPLFCRSPAVAEAESWGLTHAYAAAGSYHVSVTVTANCTTDRATTSVGVTVS
jgi:hypothetical protein